MKKKFVNATNVTKIALSLLELERHHLQEKYHLDAESFAHQLQKAMVDYKNPPENEKERKHWNTIDNIERSLKYLINQVNSFIPLLTPETRQKLENQFHPSSNK